MPQQLKDRILQKNNNSRKKINTISKARIRIDLYIHVNMILYKINSSEFLYRLQIHILHMGIKKFDQMVQTRSEFCIDVLQSAR